MDSIENTITSHCTRANSLGVARSNVLRAQTYSEYKPIRVVLPKQSHSLLHKPGLFTC